MTLKEEVQKAYEEGYAKDLETREPNAVKIAVIAGGEKKVFTEHNFYWCGFNWLEFSGKGKNLGLKKLFPVSKKYDGGFYLNCIEEIGNQGNGDYEIQCSGYAAAARFLNGLGYNVTAGSRLD